VKRSPFPVADIAAEDRGTHAVDAPAVPDRIERRSRPTRDTFLEDVRGGETTLTIVVSTANLMS